MLHGGHVRHYHIVMQARVCIVGVSGGRPSNRHCHGIEEKNILYEKTGPLFLNIPTNGKTWDRVLS